MRLKVGRHRAAENNKPLDCFLEKMMQLLLYPLNMCGNFKISLILILCLFVECNKLREREKVGKIIIDGNLSIFPTYTRCHQKSAYIFY